MPCASSVLAVTAARRAACALFAVALLASCIQIGSPSSSSSSGGGGGGVSSSSSSGDGGDADPGVSPDRAALCDAYANSTANCCAQAPGSCPSDKATDWNDYCLKFARRCTGMPTCFSGTDCNTLIYCTGSSC